MMDIFYLIGWVALRCGIGYVYLYALYLNTKDAAARNWLVSHSAYLFPNVSEPTKTTLAKCAALAGSLMMLGGGVSILVGIEPRFGALLLLLFTAIGVYQHRREREVAMQAAAAAEPFVQDGGKGSFSTLQWSAYSGQLSSGLKNWGLCGICVAIIGLPTGPWVVSDHIASILK